MTDAAIMDRDEQVAEALSAGRSLRRIQRDFALTQAELDAALEKLWPVSNDARIRMIKHDLARLERVIEVLFEKSVAGDVNASIACVRAWERKAALLGLDSTQRIDLQIINPSQQPTRYEKITEAIMRIRSGPDLQPTPDLKRLNGGSPPLDHDQDDDPDEPEPLIGG